MEENTQIQLVCDYCSKSFQRDYIVHKACERVNNKTYCSRECVYAAATNKISRKCEWCFAEVTRCPCDFGKRVFCNKSCSASYNNKLRRKSRRSKCEKALFEKLLQSFPSLTFVSNDKSMLDGFEIDIAIPELNLGIEWNGVVHFRPIYGQAKLKQIQTIDSIKQDLAQRKGINLIVVPDLVSNSKKIEEAFVEIKKIIEELLKT